MAEMTPQTLKGILAARIRGSVGFDGTDTFSGDRVKAEQYYKGEPLGDEREGRSQVVSRDVAEAVDSILPPLLKIFTSGDEVVRFEPQGPEDEQASEQATDYVNHIWNQENPGFRNFNDWFKDALMKRLGTVKIWWEVKEDSAKERYEGLTDAQLQIVKADAEVEIVEAREYDDPAAPVMADPASPVMPMAGGAAEAIPVAPKLHNVTLRRRKEYGCVKVRPVPPDEFLFDRRTVAVDDGPFFGHRRKRTLSDLISDGYDKDQIMGLGGDDSGDASTETTERFKPEDSQGYKSDENLDPTMREVWVTECYVRVDYDGDGIAEYRKITVAGDGSQIEILTREGKDDNEEVDDHPFACLTPIPMPHKLVGMSMADKTKDLQDIKSILWRKALDSLYLALEPQIGAVEGQVNLDDLLNRRVAGVVRLKSANAIVPIMTPDVSPSAFNMIGYVDSVRESRTGVRRFSAGPGADALNNVYTETATGADMLRDASDEMILYFARVFAETGVKRAFMRILGLVSKHQTKPKMIRLRNQWVEMDPRAWKTSMDMTVSVGLGTGNKMQQVATITNLLGLDERIVALQGGVNGPLVTAKNIYAKLSKLIQASDLKSVDPYYTDPEQAPPQQPKPDPAMQKVQAEIQAMTAKAQAEIQVMQQKAAAQLKIEHEKVMAQIQIERERAESQAQLKAMEINAKAQSGAYAPRPAGATA